MQLFSSWDNKLAWVLKVSEEPKSSFSIQKSKEIKKWLQNLRAYLKSLHWQQVIESLIFISTNAFNLSLPQIFKMTKCLEIRITKLLVLWITVITLFRAASTNLQSLDLIFIPFFCSVLNSKIFWAESIYASCKITRYCLSAISVQIPEQYKVNKQVTYFNCRMPVGC